MLQLKSRMTSPLSRQARGSRNLTHTILIIGSCNNQYLIIDIGTYLSDWRKS